METEMIIVQNDLGSTVDEYVDGRLVQVNQFGEPIFFGERGFEKEMPIETSLKTNKSKILVTINKYNFPTSWWTKDKDGGLVQINIKDEDPDIMLPLKSWLRNQAIDTVSLEIRSMKKKAYEYSSKQLEKMIIDEEDKIIKKKGWKGIKIAAALMIGYIPDL